MKNYFLRAFKLTNQHYFDVLQRSLALIIVFLIFTEPLEQFYIAFRQLNPMSDTVNLISGLGQILTSFVMSCLYMLLIPIRTNDVLTKQKTNFWQVALKTAIPLVIESLRVFAKVIFHLILLIIPGMIQYVKLYFVPFIVLFDPVYQQQKTDALKRSEELTKGMAWPLFFVLVLDSAITLGFSVLSHKYTFTFDPFLYLLLTTLGVLISVYTYSFYYHLYNLKDQETQHGTTV